MNENKRIGNKTEKRALDLLQEHGYWCYLTPNKLNGQPCDVIAVSANKAYLLDIKHCEGEYFEFSNIQPNQEMCFEYASTLGINTCGFVVYYEQEKEFFYLPFEKYKQLKGRAKSIGSYALDYLEMEII